MQRWVAGQLRFLVVWSLLTLRLDDHWQTKLVCVVA